MPSELEALGDDLALDEDTSYLDEVPAPSDTIPGDKDTGAARTQVPRQYCLCWVSFHCHSWFGFCSFYSYYVFSFVRFVLLVFSMSLC